MFRSSANRMRAWMELVDDFLGDPPADAHDDPEPWETHPHRRPLRWQRERRGGSVPAAPAYCLCPIRRAPNAGGRDEVLR
ncbi:MAG TPA: hypothetical protein VME22_19660 [Solirubrobacteraceae bacterium]|nr:hypothetical protein [Solirubrobacteraceae bacterium]